jgi:hypothetical protein
MLATNPNPTRSLRNMRVMAVGLLALFLAESGSLVWHRHPMQAGLMFFLSGMWAVVLVALMRGKTDSRHWGSMTIFGGLIGLVMSLVVIANHFLKT